MEDNLRDALQAKEEAKKAAKADPTKVLDATKLDADIKAATLAVKTLAQTKKLNKAEAEKVLRDAHGTRLSSLFHSLDTGDALDVWDEMSDEEKRDKMTDVYMHEKYANWRDKLKKDGKDINTFDPDEQALFDRFRKAATDADEIRNRPEPPPLKPKPAQAAAK